MTATKEKTLYLGAWDFNKSVLLDHIEKKAVDAGATLKGYYSPGTIVRRIENNKREVTTGESVKTNHCNTFGSYTSFVLDGVYYSIELDDNPFFDFHIQKIKTDETGDSYTGQYYLDNLNKQNWLYDCLFSHDISKADLIECGELLFNEIMLAPLSERYFEKKRIRVSNTYDNRYHYETIIDRSSYQKKDIQERKALNF